MKLFPVFSLLVLSGCLSPLLGQTAPGAEAEPRSGDKAGAAEPIPMQLYGKIEGDPVHGEGFYVSPTGLYKVKIPVLPQLGGTVTDTLNFVTFDDDFNLHINIGALPLSKELKADFDAKGPKDFLADFFRNLVMPDHARAFPGAQMEPNAIFMPKYHDGAILIFTLLPGGSAFENRVRISATSGPAVAKRGHLCFVQSGYVFIIWTELAERVLERSTYKKSAEEENTILRQRLMALVGNMQFFAPPPETKG